MLLTGVAAIAVLAFLGTMSARSRSSTVTVPPFPQTTVDPNQPPMAFAYFYYWYDLPGGVHSGALTDQPADPDSSYKNVAWFRQQFEDMRDAGIDAALAVYWGKEEPSSDVGLANMAAAAEEMRQEGREPPRIAGFVDTSIVDRWPRSQHDLTRPENQQRFYDVVHTIYTELPREDWATVNGRPVLWLWASWFNLTFDQSFFDYVSSHFESDFGARPYIVAEASWRFANRAGKADFQQPISIDNFYVWGAALTGFREQGAGVAEVGPGYDERSLDGPGRSGRYADREGGAFYQGNLEAAVNSGHRLLAIETWNEFHEATDVADSVQYGRQYIDITRRYLDRWKAQQAPG